jgi:glycosyltransferase involved in cell wall biosynthesis
MDWKFYTTYYKDLKHLKTPIAAYNHWLQYGKAEGRIFNNNNNKITIYCYFDDNIGSGIRRVINQILKFLPCLRVYNLNSFIPGSYLIIPDVMQNKEILKIKKKYNLRLIFIFYDDVILKLPDIYQPDVVNFTNYVKFILSTADYILPISNYSYNNLLEHKKIFGIDKSITIKPCILPGEFTSSPRIMEYKTYARYQILCVSIIAQRKNQLSLITAVQNLQKKYDIELILVAENISGRPADTEYYQTIIDTIKGNPNIQLLIGTVDDIALSNYYKSCYLTVYPSIEEGFGLPILESIWYCKPCICMNYGAMAEVGQIGCIRVNNNNEFENAIERILTDKTVLENLVSEIKSSKIRTWQEYADDIAKIIDFF